MVVDQNLGEREFLYPDPMVFEYFEKIKEVSSSLECHKNVKTPVSKPFKDSKKSQDYKNKRHGRLLSRKLRNKSNKVSNADSPITVMDDELEETKESNHPEKDKLIPSFKNDPVTNQEKSRKKIDVENLNIEAMFWKDKYYNIVPILQSNDI
jgi:hypothetical protein